MEEMDNRMFKKIFVQRSDKFQIQLIRYIIVGGIAFLADFGSLYLLTDHVGLHYLQAAAAAFLVGLAVNYLLSVKWVFQVEISDRKIGRFAVFGLIGVVGLGLNELIIWLFTEKLHLYYLYSKCISTVIVLFWNFLARRRLLVSGEK